MHWMDSPKKGKEDVDSTSVRHSRVEKIIICWIAIYSHGKSRHVTSVFLYILLYVYASRVYALCSSWFVVNASSYSYSKVKCHFVGCPFFATDSSCLFPPPPPPHILVRSISEFLFLPPQRLVRNITIMVLWTEHTRISERITLPYFVCDGLSGGRNDKIKVIRASPDYSSSNQIYSADIKRLSVIAEPRKVKVGPSGARTRSSCG